MTYEDKVSYVSSPRCTIQSSFDEKRGLLKRGVFGPRKSGFFDIRYRAL